jgi:hypothetical protein
MDPNETLKWIDSWLKEAHERYLQGRDRLPANPDIDEWCRNLWEWLQKGGFEPDWEKYPLGTSYFNCQKIDFEKEL